MDSEQGHRAEESSASSVPPPMPLPEGGYTCDSCGRDITLHCFIRCAECRVTKDQEAVDICLECFATGREPLGHQKTHAYRVMDKLQEKIFHENWTAAEELSLIEQVRKHGLGAWETLAESKMFFRRKTASDLCKHYLDTYLCRYGSILPPFYLHHRPDGTVERVPIPATGPEPHDARLKDLQVNSQEVRARTIAELGTDPQFRYESSWEALTKKQAAKNARDAAMKAAEAVEIAAAAAARANTANANVDAAPDESNLGDTCTASPRDGYPWDNRAVASIPALVTMSIPGVGDNNQSISGGDRSDAADGRRAKCLDRRAIAEAAVKAGEAAKAAAAMAAAAAAAAAEAGVDIGEFNSAADEEAGSGAGGSSSGIRIVQARGRRLKQQQNMKNKEEERAIKEWVRTLPGGDIDGYAPLRGDFEVEHDNKAEELLVNMEFSKTDHPSERQLKLDVVAVYNHRLDERERRKRFVLEHNLLDYKKDPVTPKRRRKEDQGLVSRLRPFARFHSVEEHDELIDNLLLAKKMRVRIAQLRKYQELGISTLAEAHEYEMAKRKQEELASKKHREASSSSSSSSSYLYGGHAISRYNAEERCKRYDNRNEAQGVRFVPLPAMLSPQHERIKHANGPTGAARGGSDLMDLSDAPGVEYLAPAEQRICSELHLLPGYYLVVKDAMIQECARTGCLKRENIYGLAVMDTGRLDKMFDFFKTCGWIYDVPHPEAVPDGAGKSISA